MRTRRAALAVLCAADLLVMLDGMVVAVALPSIGRDLGFSAANLRLHLRDGVRPTHRCRAGRRGRGREGPRVRGPPDVHARGGAIVLAALATVAAAGGFGPAYLTAAGLAVLGAVACTSLR